MSYRFIREREEVLLDIVDRLLVNWLLSISFDSDEDISI